VRWIVVDNGSNDDTVEVARLLGAEVLELRENRGFSAANNIGLRLATSDFVCFVNPDVTIDVDSLDRLAHACQSTGGLVAPQLLNTDGSTQANGRGFPLLADKVTHRLRPDASRISAAYHRVAAPGRLLQACWLMGAAVAARRDVFTSLGGWDEWFFLYHEDSDLCLRAWRAGVPVAVAGDIRWTHGWARETATLNWTPWRRELMSMLKFYSRYPEFLLGPGAARRTHRDIANALAA
jgi:GT2 family glycosyltransferase